jgi:hypothetical protein
VMGATIQPEGNRVTVNLSLGGGARRLVLACQKIVRLCQK